MSDRFEVPLAEAIGGASGLISADGSVEVVSVFRYAARRTLDWWWPSGVMAVALGTRLVVRGRLDSLGEVALVVAVVLVTVPLVIRSNRERRRRRPASTLCTVSLPARARQMLGVRSRRRWFDPWVTNEHALLVTPDVGLVFLVGHSGNREMIPLRQLGLAVHVKCLASGRVLSVDLRGPTTSARLRAVGRVSPS